MIHEIRYLQCLYCDVCEEKAEVPRGAWFDGLKLAEGKQAFAAEHGECGKWKDDPRQARLALAMRRAFRALKNKPIPLTAGAANG